MSDNRAQLDRASALTGLLVVLAANALYLAGLSTILDPMLSTDPYYIRLAREPLAQLLREDPAWGPLYALWLKLFTLALADPLAVYAANLCALSLAVCVALYGYVLLLTRRAAVAVGSALFFLISDFNVPLANKVGAFVLLILLAGLSAAECVAGAARRSAVLAAAVLLAAYARPELYPAAVALCLASVWLAIRDVWRRSDAAVGRRSPGRAVLCWPAGAIAVLGLAAGAIGTPLGRPQPGDSRLFIAFREHFAWNWNDWQGDWRPFEEAWQAAFGSAHSVGDAWRANPIAVLHHLADNLLGALRFLAGSAFDHYPVLVAAEWPDLTRAENWLVAAGAVGSLILVAGRATWRRQMAERYGHLWLPYAVLTACSLGAATLIYPISHYLLVAAVLLLIAAALAASVLLPTGAAPVGWVVRVGAALACLAAVPRPFILPSAYVVAGAPFKADLRVSRPIADTVAVIRGLGLPAPVQVLTLTDGLGDLLGPGFHEVKLWAKEPRQSLADYIWEQRIDVIFSPDSAHDSFFVVDDYWRLIQTQPEQAGFNLVPVPGNARVRVYVRSAFRRD
ncbi:MAG: hypothetical protein ABI629_05095 [bacterium]